MNAPANIAQPSRIEMAHDRVADVLAALESGKLEIAVELMRSARIIVETELQFRAGRKGAA